jgi:hypothetical protein
MKGAGICGLMTLSFDDGLELEQGEEIFAFSSHVEAMAVMRGNQLEFVRAAAAQKDVEKEPASRWLCERGSWRFSHGLTVATSIRDVFRGQAKARGSGRAELTGAKSRSEQESCSNLRRKLAPC